MKYWLRIGIDLELSANIEKKSKNTMLIRIPINNVYNINDKYVCFYKNK